MASLDSIKENLIDSLQTRWGEFQETTLYNNIKEKYDDLTPPLQKLVRIVCVLFVILILVYIPYTFFETSQQSMVDFDERKAMTRELLRLKRDLAQAPDVPPHISSSQLKTQVDQTLNDAKLLPEQIKSVTSESFEPDKTSLMVPSNFTQEGVQVQLAQLNLTQIIDLGHRMKNLSPGIKLAAMDIKATDKDVHYYDVMYRLVSYAIPEAPQPAGKPKK